MLTARSNIGLAPKSARMGDLVCILFGCSVPVVLRRSGDAYFLIGECYAHGVGQVPFIAFFFSHQRA